MFELTVIVKGNDSTYKQKHLVHDHVVMDQDDPKIRELINLALENAKVEDPQIKIKTSMEIV